MAKSWLDKYNKRNRHVREGAIKNYADDMREGRWELTHQGIAFYEDGVLADGQHRLLAVIKANRDVPFMVTHGLPKKAGAVLDQHTKRQAHDAIAIGGLADGTNRNIVAITRFIMSGMGVYTKPRSVHDIAWFIKKYYEVLSKVDRMVLSKKRQVTHAGILSVYVCALLAGESEEKIARFTKVMYTGEPAGPHENAAIRLREYLLMTPNAWVGSIRAETCKRAMRALHAFVRGQPLGRLAAPAEFIYSVPEE
jgi:hypothetical protein